MVDAINTEKSRAAEPAETRVPWDNWVLDASMGWPPCFCPIEGDLAGEFAIVTGMNFIGKLPAGRIVAIIHPGGQSAVDAFYEEHREELMAMVAEASACSSARRSDAGARADGASPPAIATDPVSPQNITEA